MKKSLLIFILVGFLASFQTMAFSSFVVKRIRVEGLHRVSEGAVLNELPIRLGEQLSEDKVSEGIRALYKTGFFKEVTLAQDGNTLIVRVIERATISKLTIKGIKESDKAQKVIREQGLAEGRLFDPTVLSAVQKELERYYFSKGKYGVKIETSVTEESPSQVAVVLDIYEGTVAKIKQIKIVGNCAFPESELLKQFNSAPTNLLSWFSNDDQYAKEKLYADLEILRSYYMDRGYIHFQVESSQVSLSPDKKCIFITIQVTEGDRYTFGDLTVESCSVVPPGELGAIVGRIQCGETFSRKALLDIKQGIEDRLGNEGFSMAEAQPSHTIDEANKQVNVVFHVVPGKRMLVNRILFKGNATTKDEVLRRELPQMEGTWISTCLIKEGKDRILRKGFGNAIEIETVPVVGSNDKVDIIYEIEEARLGQIGAGLGYSASEHLMFNFSLSQENFLGTGKGVDFSFDKSKACTNYAFGYQDPYFTIDGVGMGFSAYYNKSNLSKTTDQSVYTTDTLGGDFRWVFPLGRFEVLRSSVGYDNTRLKTSEDPRVTALAILNFVDKYGEKFDEFYVGGGWSYDSLDQRIFPKCGVMQNLNLRVVTPGAKQQYYRATYDFAWYYPLTESELWIFNLNSNLGFGDGYGKTPRMPFYRNFYAGGTRFVRGYEENSLGPRDNLGRAFGGNALVSASASLIFPNPIKPDIKCIRTALFLDAGQVYDTHGGKKALGLTSSGGIRYSVGVSLTWHTPLGGTPLSVSLAKPLNPKKGDKKRSFNFWMGTQF